MKYRQPPTLRYILPTLSHQWKCTRRKKSVNQPRAQTPHRQERRLEIYGDLCGNLTTNRRCNRLLDLPHKHNGYPNHRKIQYIYTHTPACMLLKLHFFNPYTGREKKRKTSLAEGWLRNKGKTHGLRVCSSIESRGI
jgi:hypothetical protein